MSANFGFFIFCFDAISLHFPGITQKCVVQLLAGNTLEVVFRGRSKEGMRPLDLSN